MWRPRVRAYYVFRPSIEDSGPGAHHAPRVLSIGLLLVDRESRGLCDGNRPHAQARVRRRSPLRLSAAIAATRIVEIVDEIRDTAGRCRDEPGAAGARDRGRAHDGCRADSEFCG